MSVSRLCLPLLFLALALTGCAGGEKQRKKVARPKVPDWVFKTPDVKGKICAVGTSGATYRPQDAKEYAAESARAELSRAISVRIQSVMVDYQQSGSRGDWVDEAHVSQMSSWATDAVLAGSTIVGYWYDEVGAGGGGKKHTYALCCMSLDTSVAELGKRLKEAQMDAKAREEVKERAAELFKELEMAEGGGEEEEEEEIEEEEEEEGEEEEETEEE